MTEEQIREEQIRAATERDLRAKAYNDGRRETSSVRRTGLEIGWEPGREVTEIAECRGD